VALNILIPLGKRVVPVTLRQERLEVGVLFLPEPCKRKIRCVILAGRRKWHEGRTTVFHGSMISVERLCSIR